MSLSLEAITAGGVVWVHVRREGGREEGRGRRERETEGKGRREGRVAGKGEGGRVQQQTQLNLARSHCYPQAHNHMHHMIIT